MDSLVKILKFIWMIFWASVASIVLFLPILIAALMSKTGTTAFNLSRLWARWMRFVSGVKIVFKGGENLDPNRNYVIIANHQSLYDIPALVASGLQFRWVIKREILRLPLFGYGLYAMRNIFIDRSNQAKAIESLNKGVDRLPPGIGVMFFPEGTRSPDGCIQRFKKGAFVVAVENGLPILPVTINGSRRILPKKELAFSPGTIEVIIGDPIETTGYSHETLSDLIEKSRTAILSNFNPDYPGT